MYLSILEPIFVKMMVIVKLLENESAILQLLCIDVVLSHGLNMAVLLVMVLLRLVMFSWSSID